MHPLDMSGLFVTTFQKYVRAEKNIIVRKKIAADS
jgi:hypothetical protein